MRVFVALKIPPALQTIVHEKLESIKEQHPDFRWITEENMHITLAFMGDIDQKGLTFLTDIVQAAALRTQAIAVTTHALLLLPNKSRASVLALGFKTGRDHISMLSTSIETQLTEYTAKKIYAFRPCPSRPPKPHITLARSAKSPLKLLAEEELHLSGIAGTLDTLTIIKSDLYRNGAVYTPLSLFTIPDHDSPRL
jgi:2'-5' RNA ligase